MKTNFRTNIDCCRSFMPSLNDSDLGVLKPLVGDYVVVYQEQKKVVTLEVGARIWEFADDRSAILTIELHLTRFWAGRLLDFEAFVKGTQ